MNKWQFAKWFKKNHKGKLFRAKVFNSYFYFANGVSFANDFDSELIQYRKNNGKEPKEADWKPLPKINKQETK